MYSRVTGSRIRVELASPACFGLGIRKKLFYHVYTSDALPYTEGNKLLWHVYTYDGLPYTGGTRIPCLLGFRNYLNNYVANYTCLTRSRIREELTSPAYLGIGII